MPATTPTDERPAAPIDETTTVPTTVPRSVELAIRATWALVVRDGLLVVLLWVFRDDVIGAWASGHQGAREVFDQGGREGLERAGFVPPSFLPVAATMLGVGAMLVWVLRGGAPSGAPVGPARAVRPARGVGVPHRRRSASCSRPRRSSWSWRWSPAGRGAGRGRVSGIPTPVPSWPVRGRDPRRGRRSRTTRPIVRPDFSPDLVPTPGALSAGRCTVQVFEHMFDHPAPGAGDLDPRSHRGRITGVDRAARRRERHEAVRRPGGDPDGAGVGDGGSRAVPVAGAAVEGAGGDRPLGGDRSVVAVRGSPSGDRLRRAGERPRRPTEPRRSLGRRPLWRSASCGGSRPAAARGGLPLSPGPRGRGDGAVDGGGVFDLAFDWGDGRWALVGCAD